MAPFDIIDSLGKGTAYLIYLLIGIGFGAALELSGFGDTRKLAAQFYFREMTVLKVMFTAIIVAMLLIFLSSSMGIVDFDRIWVNHTFLWSQIAGGLIMGVGFIVGGFCPGTSLVSASTLKIDGIFFVAGVFFGVYIFGLSYDGLYGLYTGGDMGRFTLPELFGVSYGAVVFAVILMALAMFYGAEISERFFGRRMKLSEINYNPLKLLNPVFAGSLILAAVVVLAAGQPGYDEKWERVSQAEKEKFSSGKYLVHPVELLETMNDFMLYSKIIDLRPEREFNLFHLEEAIRMEASDLENKAFMDPLLTAPSNTVVILVSSTGSQASQLYKKMRVRGVNNIYVLEGGLNAWLKVFPLPAETAEPVKNITGADSSSYIFRRAVGSSAIQSNPKHNLEKIQAQYKIERNIKIQRRKTATGGCG